MARYLRQGPGLCQILNKCVEIRIIFDTRFESMYYIEELGIWV